MKKSLLLFIGLFLITSNRAAQGATQELQDKESGQKIVIPKITQNLNNAQEVKQFLQQHKNCLFFEENKCPAADQLPTIYALGYLVGTNVPMHYLLDFIEQYRNAARQETIDFSLQFILFVYPSLNWDWGQIPFHTKATTEIAKALCFILDVPGLILQPLQPDSIVFFKKALGNYLMTNAPCILSKDNCKPSFLRTFGLHLRPFEQQKILYFWLGLLSGALSRSEEEKGRPV